MSASHKQRLQTVHVFETTILHLWLGVVLSCLHPLPVVTSEHNVHSLVPRPVLQGISRVCGACRTSKTYLLLVFVCVLQDLGIDGVYADGTTAAALNSNALQAALAAVSPTVVERYRKSGWQLNFATDVLVADSNAEKFIREGAMKFSPQQDASSSGRGTVEVTAPVLTSKSVGEIRKLAAAGKPDDPATAAMMAAADDPYMVRFLGNWYTKVSTSNEFVNNTVLSNASGIIPSVFGVIGPLCSAHSLMHMRIHASQLM
jgi:hypothetical protein